VAVVWLPARSRAEATGGYCVYRSPASQLVVLPKLGHACVIEDPAACSAEIRRFVNTAS
jgi:hypothetical protein